MKTLITVILIMLKSLHLIPVVLAVLLLFIAETPSRSIAKNYQYPQYPVVSNSDIDMLVCYMQTADGRTLDLSNLCRKPLERLLLSCLTITDSQVRTRIAQFCGNDDRCLASVGCRQPGGVQGNDVPPDV
jgi:hypothetical protein